MAITGSLTGTGNITGGLSGTRGITAAITQPTVVPPPSYEGIYEVTPGPEAVTLETAGLAMLHNVIINPIPQDYGKITWDGNSLTVS